MKKVLGILILLLLILTACGSGTEKITFGYGDIDEGIYEKSSTFSQEDDFVLELDMNKSFDSSEIRLLILSDSNGLESVYEEWYESVDPSWNYFIYDFQEVDYDGYYDSGDYTLRIYTNESDLLAEGSFTIQ